LFGMGRKEKKNAGKKRTGGKPKRGGKGGVPARGGESGSEGAGRQAENDRANASWLRGKKGSEVSGGWQGGRERRGGWGVVGGTQRKGGDHRGTFSNEEGGRLGTKLESMPRMGAADRRSNKGRDQREVGEKRSDTDSRRFGRWR